MGADVGKREKMTGSEIRRWARKNIGTEFWIYGASALLSGLPVGIGEKLFEDMDVTGGFSPLLWKVPLMLMGNLLYLGIAYMALTQAQGGEPGFRHLPAAFRREWFPKALLLTVITLVLRNGMSWLTGGQSVEEKNIFILCIQAVVSLLLTSLLFLLEYLLFLEPKKKWTELIQSSFSLGWENFWSILGFQIMVTLPLVGGLLAVYLLARLLRSGFLVLCGFLALFFWWVGYSELAQARFAVELVAPPEVGEDREEGLDWGENGPLRSFTAGLMGPPPSPLPGSERKMKVSGDGWYYYDGRKARRKGEEEHGI